MVTNVFGSDNASRKTHGGESIQHSQSSGEANFSLQPQTLFETHQQMPAQESQVNSISHGEDAGVNSVVVVKQENQNSIESTEAAAEVAAALLANAERQMYGHVVSQNQDGEHVQGQAELQNDIPVIDTNQQIQQNVDRNQDVHNQSQIQQISIQGEENQQLAFQPGQHSSTGLQLTLSLDTDQDQRSKSQPQNAFHEQSAQQVAISMNTNQAEHSETQNEFQPDSAQQVVLSLNTNQIEHAQNQDRSAINMPSVSHSVAQHDLTSHVDSSQNVQIQLNPSEHISGQMITPEMAAALAGGSISADGTMQVSVAIPASVADSALQNEGQGVNQNSQTIQLIADQSITQNTDQQLQQSNLAIKVDHQAVPQSGHAQAESQIQHSTQSQDIPFDVQGITVQNSQLYQQQPTYVLLQTSGDQESGGQPQVFLAMQTTGVSGQDPQQAYITLHPVSVEGQDLAGSFSDGLQQAILTQTGAAGDVAFELGQQIALGEMKGLQIGQIEADASTQVSAYLLYFSILF